MRRTFCIFDYSCEVGRQKVETIRILLFCLSTPLAKASAAGFNETVKSGPAGSLTMDLTLKLPCSPKPA